MSLFRDAVSRVFSGGDRRCYGRYRSFGQEIVPAQHSQCRPRKS